MNYDYSNESAYNHSEIIISRLIIDEVDTIKVSSSSKINADFTWFISSSIKSIQNPNGYGFMNHIHILIIKVKLCTYDRRITKGRMPHTGYFKDVLNDISCIYFKYMIYFKNQDSFIELSFKLPEINTIKLTVKEIYIQMFYMVL